MALLTRKNTISIERVFQGQILNLRVDVLQHPNGHVTDREVVEHPGGVVIACQPAPDRIILIRQYRYPVDEEILELPAGRLEAGESPLLAAQRELAEETGYRAENWKELSRMYSAPGFCDEILYLYRATGISFVGASPDEDEEIEVLDLPLIEFWKLVADGKIRDAKTIAGIGLLQI